MTVALLIAAISLSGVTGGELATRAYFDVNNAKVGDPLVLTIDFIGEADFTALPKNTQIVEEDTLRFIDEKILRTFGVPLPILTGDFTPSQHEAFYQKTIESIVIALSQAFTKKVFTDREKGYGNRIEFYTKDLIFMTIDQKMRMIELLSPTGGMFENEKRAALGLMPLPELEGQRYMSLNWINSSDASTYQTGKENVNVDIVDEEKEEV